MHHSEVRARELLKRLDVANPVGAEIGVWRGEMSAHLLKRPDLHLFMVDNWLSAAMQPRTYADSGDVKATMTTTLMGEAKLAAEHAVAFAGARACILHASSRETARVMDNAALDFVFIDAEHTYEALSADIAAWLPKLKPGGLLCGHDYSKPGERSALGWPGVVRAVDEFVERVGLRLDRGEQATWFVRLT